MCSRRKSGDDAAFETRRRLRDENRRRNAPRSRLKTLARSSTKSKIRKDGTGRVVSRNFGRARRDDEAFRRASIKAATRRQLNKTTPPAQ